MKTFLFGCIFLSCVAASAEVSRQQAHDFAARFVELSRSDNGAEKLQALIDNRTSTNGQIGWSENFWLSENRTHADLKELEINQILIREPDLDNPMQIKLTDYKIAKCLMPPEKIAVVYFSNRQKDIRAVLTMALVSNPEKIMLCPMVVEIATNKSVAPAEHLTKKIPLQKNLSTVPGVEIVKIADDKNCYGIAPPQSNGGPAAFATNPSGCDLKQIILNITDQGVWIKGLNYLPSGRFKIHCELLAGESESIETKLLNSLASAFDLNIKKDDHYAWNGYRVSVPNPLPPCFRITKNAVGQSAMHGVGDYEGYSLKDLVSNAVHDKPFDLLSTNSIDRYDVHLEIWPDAYGEIEALKQLGFEITQTNLQRKTLIIENR